MPGTQTDVLFCRELITGLQSLLSDVYGPPVTRMPVLTLALYQHWPPARFLAATEDQNCCGDSFIISS